MQIPKAGEPYRIRLDGGPLDNEHRSVVSEGGLNRSVKYEVGDRVVRYVSRGAGHDANGVQVWSYVFDEQSQG